MLRWFTDLWTQSCGRATPSTEIVCLANSSKGGGRCVAGLRMDGGGWVRPVSSEPEGVLQAWHYTLSGGGETALLDVLMMRLAGPQPEPHHPENWLMDLGQWKRSVQPTPPYLRTILMKSLAAGPELLGDRGEKIAYALLQRKPAIASLALVRPEALSWQIQEGTQVDKRRTRAVFTLAGVTYDLPLTDPIWRKHLSGLPQGCYPREEDGQDLLLTISLGEPFGEDGFCYKLVAGVITLPTAPAPAGRLGSLKAWWYGFWSRVAGTP